MHNASCGRSLSVSLVPSELLLSRTLHACFYAWMSLSVGNLLTTDPGGPYNFSLLNTQTTEVRGKLEMACTCGASCLVAIV